MFLVSMEQMRQIDRYTIDTIGIPEMALMENAGRALADEVVAYCREKQFNTQSKHSVPKWLILVGKGNNGGDGLVAARHLADSGIEPLIVHACDPKNLVGSAAKQHQIALNLKLPSITYKSHPIKWEQFDGIIDCLLGTGTKGAPREPYASLIHEANDSGLPIIALDIPSGLDADTGGVYDPTIRADRTVALAFMKKGMMHYPGAAYCGDIRLRAIGIPKKLAETFCVSCRYVTEAWLREQFVPKWFSPRQADSHKGTYGHLLVAAGSLQFSGAGILCSKAAVRSGAGLVTWLLPERMRDAVIGAVPEVMLAAVKDNGSGSWEEMSSTLPDPVSSKVNAAVAGPGMGRFAGDGAWISAWLSRYSCPLVLDADALNMLADADSIQILKQLYNRGIPVIITPHPGEMARLMKSTVSQIQANRELAALQFAEKSGAIVVLKGARTVTATPDGRTFVNSTGNPGMATGGSGDVLAGIIGSLLAQSLDPVQAAVLGVFFHGKAGDRAIDRRGSNVLAAGDLVDAIDF